MKRREKLIAARKRRGLSQEEVATAVGVIRPTYSQWECGVTTPYPCNVNALCTFYGVEDPAELDLVEPILKKIHANLQKPMARKSSLTQAEFGLERLAPHELHEMPRNPLLRRTSSLRADITSPIPNDTMSRRDAGKAIATFGAGLLTASRLFGFIQVGGLYDEEILSLCATSLPIFWRLYFDGQLVEVQRILPAYLSQLALLVRLPSHYQQQAACYASQAHQLACMLALQEQDYGTALVHVDQAFQYAHLADDAHVKVASLIRKALTYRYINRYFKPCPYQIVEACQEAVQYSSSVSPLLRGRLYTGLSEAYSGLGQADEAKQALEQAYRIFPEKPQDDPNFSYTHFKLPQHFEAIMYLNLKQAEKAWELLAKVDASIPMAVIPDRVELLMDQTRASLLLDELQQSCMYLELAVTSASALGSDLRYREASDIYRDIQVKWPHEQRVKALAEHFHL